MRKAAGNVIPAVIVNVDLIPAVFLKSDFQSSPGTSPREELYDHPDY
jgi:hypothetical protein